MNTELKKGEVADGKMAGEGFLGKMNRSMDQDTARWPPTELAEKSEPSEGELVRARLAGDGESLNVPSEAQEAQRGECKARCWHHDHYLSLSRNLGAIYNSISIRYDLLALQ